MRSIELMVAWFFTLSFTGCCCCVPPTGTYTPPAPHAAPSQPAVKPAAPTAVVERKWYQGGTLHDKGALDWQKASYDDKLATCADFIAKSWQDGSLTTKVSSKLKSVDDVRPFAEELVRSLDKALAPDPDPEQNRIMYANQTVSGMAVLSMILMEWLKKE